MRLYVVANGSQATDGKLRKIIESGATFFQLREKNTDLESFINTAKRLKKITDEYKIPFVINDNIEVAMAVGADGVHVGQSDMSAEKVREIIGDNKILGVSVQTVEQAKTAQNNGADYLGVGAMFSTNSKDDADNVTLETLKNICGSVNIPVVAIGGINEDNIVTLKDSGIDGIAVISAIFSKQNVSSATRNLYTITGDIFEKNTDDSRL